MDSSIGDNSRTLWMGDLELWMDDAFLHNMIASLGFTKDLHNIKMIKDKATQVPLKYCFIQFNTHNSAKTFYQTYNGRTIPNTGKVFKLNWAAYGSSGKATAGKNLPQDIQVYVGDLDPAVSQQQLLQHFKEKFPTAYVSKIISDPTTKVSKGYGFVKFSSLEESQKAIAEMNGQPLMGRPLKVSTAYMKNKEQTQENEENDGQVLTRQKLYSQFYSYMNDPQFKAEYEKQILKTFGSQDTKKPSLKQRLESIQTLSYEQTRPSQALLKTIPQAVAWSCRDSVQRGFFR